MAPDDDPAFLAGIDNSRAERLSEWEADLKRREDELRRREDSSES